jgi:hypothetical protein
VISSTRSAHATVFLVAAAVVTIVTVIYREATLSYFFNDDFHWLAQSQLFEPSNLLHLERYDHFYRPVIEIYFFVGLTLFGCDAFPFHVASVIIHLLTAFVLFQFARTLAASTTFALLTAALFAVQPGYTEAVSWVGAITDLLPALWYLLTLWLYLLFLRHRRHRDYVGALATFVVCHLTHETAVTLLPMMMALEFSFSAQGGFGERLAAIIRHWKRYTPFALLLVAYLAMAYVVNTRSYLVREGHYAFGWHAAPNVINYIVSLYVGKRVVLDYLLTVGAIGALLWWGNARARFAVLWIFVTLAPVSFFTWGNVSRYLYLPAAGFAIVLADLLMAVERGAVRRASPRTARALMIVATVALAARFAVFAKKGADSFRDRTAPYERFVAALRSTSPNPARSETVSIDHRLLEGIPELYREPAAQVGLCVPGVRLRVW